MRTTTLLATMAVLAAAISAPVLAGDRERQPERPHRSDARPAASDDRGMQAVAHHAAPNEPGHGWQYFTDPAARRAVVISPQGDYYLSQGRGLRWVAGRPAGA